MILKGHLVTWIAGTYFILPPLTYYAQGRKIDLRSMLPCKRKKVRSMLSTLNSPFSSITCQCQTMSNLILHLKTWHDLKTDMTCAWTQCQTLHLKTMTKVTRHDLKNKVISHQPKAHQNIWRKDRSAAIQRSRSLSDMV